MSTYKFDDKLEASVAGMVAIGQYPTKTDAIAGSISHAVEAQAGTATEIKSSTRLTLAYAILLGVASLFAMAGFFLIHAPADKALQAQTFFEFAKSFGPPLVTLVIGYYFRETNG